MKIMSNPINFKADSQGFVLSDADKRGVQERAKAFEDKLVKMGQDGFVKNHERVRKDVFAFKLAARHACDGHDFDFTYDPEKNFQYKPAKRFDYLLRKAQKYQTSEAIDEFARQEADKFDADIKVRRTQIELLQEKLDKDIKNRASIVREKTLSWMGEKLDFLGKLFDDSQKFPSYYAEERDELISSGELSLQN